MENNSTLVITIVTILIVGSGLVVPSASADGLILINNVTSFASPYGTISVNATCLDDIVTIPVYHGTFGENGSINLQLQQIGKERQNVTPASEAPAAAQKALEEYGGLPQDAVLNGASTTYSEIYNYTLHATTYKKPMFTTVSYSREIPGFWVYGDSNTIILTLGENGELLWLFKVWRDYTYVGDAKLIPVYTALEKLKRGEVLDEPMVSGEKITIDLASPDYYAKEIGNNETVLEPIWLLAGTTESGTRIGFHIYARQFANFTATPAVASISDTIIFTDTSEASPSKWFWDFGDGTNSTVQNPMHKYTKGGNFTVNLTVWNDMGSDTISRQNCVSIYPTPAPVASFTSNFTWENTKVPVAIAFNSTSKGNITTWIWDFGDGTNSTERNPVHIYDLPEGVLYGSYAPTLNVMDDLGRTSSVTGEWMYLDRMFVMNFSASPTSGSSPLNVTFLDTSTPLNSYNTFRWDFGDGNRTEWTSWDSSTPPRSITHEYASAGNYSVTLEICYSVDGEICEQITKDNYVLVKDPEQIPVTDFTANNTYGKQPLSVAFTAISDGSLTIWLWDFGDSEVSSLQNPVHIYTTAGNYSVNLTVIHSGGSNSTKKTDYITVLPLVTPDASFTADPVFGKLPLNVVFNDTSTGSPTTWFWDFGDGVTSTEQHPIHKYTAAGSYTVSLTAISDDGSDMETRPDYISVTPLIFPNADFTVNTTSGEIPLAVAFTDVSAGSPTGWSWTFGDGGISEDQNPVHVYTIPGEFTVSLQVTNEDGSNITTKPGFITVSTNILSPVANFTGKPTCGKAPLTVKFNDTSTGLPTAWIWNFGDGTSSTLQNPVHVYTAVGKYTVSLIATNNGGSNTSTRKDYFTVSGSVKPPNADFHALPTSGKAPLSVKFTDTSAGSPTIWHWEFGDGTTGTNQNPVHNYTTAGKYTVSLTVTNTGGSDTKTRQQYISVRAPTPTPTCTTKPTTTCTPKPTTSCTTKPTVTCTTKPTTTCTQSSCEPHTPPVVTGQIENGKIRLDWDVITNPCLQGYKVVISKSNPTPKYPDDGYMFWITDRNTNHAVISSTDHYNGGDFGGYLQPGQTYFFSITAVYSDAKVAGNAVQMTYP